MKLNQRTVLFLIAIGVIGWLLFKRFSEKKTQGTVQTQTSPIPIATGSTQAAIPEAQVTQQEQQAISELETTFSDLEQQIQEALSVPNNFLETSETPCNLSDFGSRNEFERCRFENGAPTTDPNVRAILENGNERWIIRTPGAIPAMDTFREALPS